MLLVSFLKFKASLNCSLSNLVAFLRWNLFTYRDLWDWLNRPEDTPPLEPPPRQQSIPDVSGTPFPPTLTTRAFDRCR
jgi:hypothetical protein